MSKLKTAKRKVKHLRKAYHRLVIESNKMVSIDDVADWVNNGDPKKYFYQHEDIKDAINDMRLERSKNSFYEHCIQPYRDTTREEFEIEYQEKFGGGK